jgi:hypothetical protein
MCRLRLGSGSCAPSPGTLGLAQQVLMMGLGQLLKEERVRYPACTPFTVSPDLRCLTCLLLCVHQGELLLTVYIVKEQNASGESRESTSYLEGWNASDEKRCYGESRRGGQTRWCSMA